MICSSVCICLSVCLSASLSVSVHGNWIYIADAPQNHCTVSCYWAEGLGMTPEKPLVLLFAATAVASTALYVACVLPSTQSLQSYLGHYSQQYSALLAVRPTGWTFGGLRKDWRVPQQHGQVTIYGGWVGVAWVCGCGWGCVCVCICVCLSDGSYVGTYMYCTKWACMYIRTHAACQQQPLCTVGCIQSKLGMTPNSELPTVSIR